MTIIHEEQLNSISYDDTDYLLRQASLEDAYEIWWVMNHVSQSMKHPEHFICDDLDYVTNLLSGHGFAVAACDSTGKIVGNLLVKYPGLTDENLGYDVFTEENLKSEKLLQVVHMDSASVLCAHRGHGLESRMIAYAEQLLDSSQYKYSFATVAPQNLASLKSLERSGYRVMMTKEKYGGRMRCIMMKELPSGSIYR